MGWDISWRVLVDGIDMSAKMNEYLIELEVNDKDGAASDTASLTLSDTDGILRLPRQGALLVIELDGVGVFEGTIDEVRSSGGKGQGREISVSAKGMDTGSKVKEPLSLHEDEATLGSFLKRAAQRAGLSDIFLSPEFAQKKRDYWAADGESFLHLGRRLAEELGGSFKIRGDKAVLAKRGAGLSATGQALPLVQAKWGDNLISWDIAPFIGRPRFKKTKARYFDRGQARWREEEVKVEVEGKEEAQVVDVVRFSKADADEAKGAAEGRKAESERQGGEGSVELTLTPSARAEGGCMISGVRPGVDGLYRVTGVAHRLSRSGGSGTSLELKQPQGAAGKDER